MLRVTGSMPLPTGIGPDPIGVITDEAPHHAGPSLPTDVLCRPHTKFFDSPAGVLIHLCQKRKHCQMLSPEWSHRVCCVTAWSVPPRRHESHWSW